MISVVITSESGKNLSPKELASAVDLRAAAKQAKLLCEECERLALLHEPAVVPPPRKTGLPYM